MTVIDIQLSTDLPTRRQNELRHRLELCRWKDRWRRAESENDFQAMDRLDREYELIGLP